MSNRAQRVQQVRANRWLDNALQHPSDTLPPFPKMAPKTRQKPESEHSAEQQDYPILNAQKWLKAWRNQKPNRQLLATPWEPSHGNGPDAKTMQHGVDPVTQQYHVVNTTGDVFGDDVTLPINVKLCDWAVYQVVHVCDVQERSERWKYDFGKNGLIRATRIPNGQPVLIEAHGLLWFPVFSGYYVLLGDASKTVNWIINAQRPASAFKHMNGFYAGLVLAPGQTTDSHLTRQLTLHDRPADKDDVTGFELAAQRNASYDRWIADLDSPVLDPFGARIRTMRALKPSDKCNPHADDASTDRLKPQPQAAQDIPQSKPADDKKAPEHHTLDDGKGGTPDPFKKTIPTGRHYSDGTEVKPATPKQRAADHDSSITTTLEKLRGQPKSTDRSTHKRTADDRAAASTPSQRKPASTPSKRPRIGPFSARRTDSPSPAGSSFNQTMQRLRAPSTPANIPELAQLTEKVTTFEKHLEEVANAVANRQENTNARLAEIAHHLDRHEIGLRHHDNDILDLARNLDEVREEAMLGPFEDVDEDTKDGDYEAEPGDNYFSETDV